MFQADSPSEPAGKAIAWATLVLLIAFILTLLSQPMAPAKDPTILWPTHAILAGLLLRFRVLRHFSFWLAIYAGPTLARLFLGLSWNLANLYSLIDLSGILAIRFILLSRWAPKNLRSPQAIGRVLLAGAAAAAVTASLALALLPGPQLPGDPASTAANWFFSQLLGYCIFLPPVLLLPKYGSRSTDQAALQQGWLTRLRHPASLLPFIALAISMGLCFLLGGLGAIAFPIPALLYCAWLYPQRVSAWLTAGTATLLVLSMAHGWIPTYIAPSDAHASPWAATSLHLGILLLVTAPMLLSGTVSVRDDQIFTLTQALNHDTLTRALSRAAFLRHSRSCLRTRAARPPEAGMLMLDLDHFKHLNDHYGHAAGDQALREFSSCIHAAIRPQDLFGRVGGEEFGITLPDTPLQASIDIAERLRASIEALVIRLPDSTGLSITVSIGVAHTSQSPHDSPEELLTYADQALYQAKRNGRNQVSVCRDDSRPVKPPEGRMPDSSALPPASTPTSIMPVTNEVSMTDNADRTPLIALLEDDPTQSAWLQQILLPAGFGCRAFDNGNDLLATLRTSDVFQLLLLDWELPGISGMEVLRWVRANLPSNPPVIFVTSRTLESDLVEGLDAGANDYVCKPCRPAELLARIRAQLRPQQSHASPDTSFRLGDFSVDTIARHIELRGEIIQMTPKEFDLAALFLRHPWRLFSRDDLSALIWNREIPSTSRTLDTHLSNIRKKLQLGPASGTLLNASYALGYRLELLDEHKAIS
ncbi:diguanylate cyclase [Castellaniella sp.]|uniref:diguanylate cyclase n=1 Tax=Castellaniella sp. TaxID=1955812 RepID=UPI003C712037